MLLLLASFVASFYDCFFGIHGHPSFVTQSNVLKTLIVAFGVFNNALTFPSSPSSCASFGLPILVHC
jgi:hypothetical protein